MFSVGPGATTRAIHFLFIIIFLVEPVLTWCIKNILRHSLSRELILLIELFFYSTTLLKQKSVVRSNYSIFGRGPNQLRESGRLDVKVTKKSIRKSFFVVVFLLLFFFLTFFVFSPLWNVWSWFLPKNLNTLSL